MSFYQNVFDTDYRGNLLLADRQYIPTYKVPANVNTTQSMIAWNREPYNVSSNTTLTFNYSFDSGRTYTALAVNVSTSAVNTSAATCAEIVTALNASTAWATLYSAEVTTDKSSGNWVRIKALRPRGNWKTYISNSSAEKVLRFNKRAGVAELPSYFSKDTISNATNSNSVGLLILLDTGDATDQNIITEAGFSYAAVQSDWQLMVGQSGMFQSQIVTTDAANSHRITQIIEFPAGASAGFLGKKTTYSYTGGNTSGQPNKVVEIPYVITSGDVTGGSP